MENKEKNIQQLSDEQLQKVSGGMLANGKFPSLDEEYKVCIEKGGLPKSCCHDFPTASQCRQN